MKASPKHAGRLSYLIASVLTLFTLTKAHAETFPGQVNVVTNYGEMPLRFEANAGQTDSQFKYYSRGSGYTMFFAPSEVILALDVSTNQPVGRPKRHEHLRVSHKREISLVHIKLDGSDANAVISSEQPLPGNANYLIGNDPTQWKSGVSVYGQVRYQNVYPGVDLIFHGSQSQLEHDFIVSPHADTQKIQMLIDGAESVELDPSGDLVFEVRGRTGELLKPVAYQEIGGIRQGVTCRYRLAGHRVSLELGSYDKSQTLIIDPVLSYSTYFGGAGADIALGVTADSGGNAYVVGETLSLPHNLITSGAFQTNFAGGSFNGDVFVAKIGSAGTNLVYCTYLGGNSDDAAADVAVDSVGNAYVTGWTMSANFPVTPGAFATNICGPFDYNFDTYWEDVFVTKLNTNGSGLIYSTYIGGEQIDVGVGIAIDSATRMSRGKPNPPIFQQPTRCKAPIDQPSLGFIMMTEITCL